MESGGRHEVDWRTSMVSEDVVWDKGDMIHGLKMIKSGVCN